jgi:hypothetical protein
MTCARCPEGAGQAPGCGQPPPPPGPPVQDDLLGCVGVGALERAGGAGDGNDEGPEAVVVVVLLGELLLRELHDGDHLLGQHLGRTEALQRMGRRASNLRLGAGRAACCGLSTCQAAALPRCRAAELPCRRSAAPAVQTHLAEHHDLRDQREVGHHHGHGAQHGLEVVRQLGAACGAEMQVGVERLHPGSGPGLAAAVAGSQGGWEQRCQAHRRSPGSW